MNDFNLSDKWALAKRLSDDTIVFREQDIKEFIKRLKESLKICYEDKDYIYSEIEKLAGSKLIEIQEVKE